MFVITMLLLISYAGVMSEKLQEQSAAETESATAETPVAESVQYDAEIHLSNVRQLTFGGDNAEAYWSFNSDKLVFQYRDKAKNLECDQIFWTTERMTSCMS